MTDEQAQAQTPANPEGAQAQTPADGSLSPDLQKYVADPTPNVPANPPGAQAQGQSPPAAEAQPDSIKDLQRIAEQRKVELYQERQRGDQLQQQLLEVARRNLPQQTQPQNPHDPNNNWPEWFRWESQSSAKEAARMAAEEARKASRDEIANIMQQAQEYQWAQSHPGVDVNALKAYARMNGFPEWNLDASYRLMNYPSQIAQVAQNTAQQAFTQFRQPQNTGAIPVRGATGGGDGPRFSYEKLAQDYQATRGAVYDSWPPELRTAFDRETSFREAQRHPQAS